MCRGEPNRDNGCSRAAQVAVATKRGIRTSTVAQRRATVGRCAFRLRTNCRRAQRCRPTAMRGAMLRCVASEIAPGRLCARQSISITRLMSSDHATCASCRARMPMASRKSGWLNVADELARRADITIGFVRVHVGSLKCREWSLRALRINRCSAAASSAERIADKKCLIVDHAAQPREDPQVFVVARRANQEEDIGEPAAAAERNAAGRNAECEQQLRPGSPASAGADASSATPLSSAVECISSRARTASAIFAGSHSKCVRAASSVIFDESRCRGCGHRAGLRSPRFSTNPRSKLLRHRRRPRDRVRLPCARGFVIGKPDAIFEPMVNFGGRESPLAADAPGRQLAAFC